MGIARAERAALGVLLRWTLVLGVFVGGFSCAVSRPLHVPAPREDAVEVFHRARAIHRRIEGGERLPPAEERALVAEASRLLEHAEQLDPTWAAPPRMRDELDRRTLRGARAYERRLGRLAAAPHDAVALYLVGRLEVDQAGQRFAQALAADASLAWAHHGLSVTQQNAGRRGPALAAAERAYERARGGYEANTFARRFAERLAAEGRAGEGRRVLERTYARTDLAPVDRLEVGVALALAELGTRDEPAIVERGYRRGLELVAGGELQRRELAALVAGLAAGREGRSLAAWSFDVLRALEGGRAGAVFGFDARTVVDSDAGWVLIAAGAGTDAPAADRRIASFQAGQFAEAVERWRAELPAAVVDGDRRPLDPTLQSIVVLASGLADAPDRGAALHAFAEACLRAGWFEEASAVAFAMARAGATDASREVDLAARAGRALVGELTTLLGAVQGGPASWWFEPDPRAIDDAPMLAPSVPHASGGSSRDLDGLLDAAARLATAYGAPLGVDDASLAERVRASPRIRYGPFAEVVVPGPVFAARDERQRLGAAGERVPGLAELMDALGRVALVGEGVGRGADGTVLRRLAHERVEGERLGVAYEGVRIWCEGTDFGGGLARTGNLVSGAALHEGYWIDIDSERRRHRRWRDLEARYLSGDDTTEAEDVLAEPGLAVAGDPKNSDLARHERRRVAPPLGAGDRVRLAVLLERSRERSDPTRELVSLDELLEVIAIHEEGHLMDRTRFLPLGRRFGRILGFTFRAGVWPAAIERELERRAQLVALCEAPDPRLPLVEILDAAEMARATGGAHSRGYSKLLAELLVEIDRRIDRDPDALPGLDRTRTFVHQLHRLTPDEVRSLALEIAQRDGVAAR